VTNSSEKLLSQYKRENRYNNFGECLRQIDIDGFRGIFNCPIQFDFPITAISGLNGAGKSTIGQIAICGYKKPTISNDYKRRYIKDFFPISIADPHPITNEAKLIYTFETNDYSKPQRVTVSRADSSWSGYKRQPERYCYYIGFTVYIPKIERRDLSIYGASSLKFSSERKIDSSIIQQMSKIIGYNYDNVEFKSVAHNQKELEIGIASRLGYSYSENNMGFGEGRVLYTIDELENSPDKSLFIIEEPETSLHESAQHELTKYLLDVCLRKHHQIILSTHSDVILSGLPPEALKFVSRDKQGVKIIDQVSSMHMKSLLSGGHTKALDIFVEDEFAKTLLTEIIRLKDHSLLQAVAIYPIGDTKKVFEIVSIFRKTGKNAIAVRDADIGDDVSQGLYKFPGKFPPEREVFQNSDVKSLVNSTYKINVDWLLQKNDSIDHH
jgi:predicted ATPase